MKTKNLFWALLSVMAAFIITACSKEVNQADAPVVPETPATTSVTIPYTVTVSGDPETRATVDSDYQTLRYAAGDKLYVTGTNLQGVLDIETGVGETSGATFSGELTYIGKGFPADNLPVTATLVSAQQRVGAEVSVDDAGAVTVNYPAAYCSDVNEAVQKYSNLTGTSTYGARSFSLSQHTAFLNFEITFEDGTITGALLNAIVSNNGAPICTASVTTVTKSEMVFAQFVLPVAAGTTLSSASVKMGGAVPNPFGSDGKELEGKVYNVERTVVWDGALTIEALTAGTVNVNIIGTLSSGMKYSVNGGNKTTITSSTDIPVNAGDKVEFYGNGTATQVYGGNPSVTILGRGDGFTCKAYGNIMSLLDEEGFGTKTDLPNKDDVFKQLFCRNTALTDASGLVLPATTLTAYCYSEMFYGCSALTAAPALPATKMANYCYAGMFKECTALPTAPELPAETLANGCYYQMFYYCTALPTAPELPAETLANGCYNQMFYHCPALTTAPELPAKALVPQCYYKMFEECSLLSSVKCLALSGINENDSTCDWLNLVGLEGTLYLASGAGNKWPEGVNGIPFGWTGKYPDGSTWAVPRPLSSVTAADLGNVIGADSNIYHTVTAAANAGTNAVAMIAIVDGINRFAVQLKPGDKMNWEDAQTYANSLNTSIPIKNGFWFLPYVEQWKDVFKACAAEGDTEPWGALTKAGDSMIIRGFRDKVLATGTTEWGYSCWTSSEVPAYLYFYLDESRVVLFGNDKTYSGNVHAFLRLPFPDQG